MSKRTKWTAQDIKNLNLKSNIDDTPNKKHPALKDLTVSGNISVEKQHIKTVLWVFKRDGKIKDYVEEYEFSDTRKFRFDWAIPDIKCAVEYEGLFSEKSGHTTVSGYTKDCKKYNLAQLEGWTVLRYTAINHQNISKDLEQYLEMIKSNTQDLP